MKLALFRHWFLFVVLIFGCGHIMPPEHLVKRDFSLPFSTEIVSERCQDILVQFLKKKYHDKAVLTLDRCFHPDVITCTVTTDINISYHWNVLIEPSNEQETKITIYRFVRSRFKCIPLSTGEQEREFIKFLSGRLQNGHG